jgi:hypothetical protein
MMAESPEKIAGDQGPSGQSTLLPEPGSGMRAVRNKYRPRNVTERDWDVLKIIQ